MTAHPNLDHIARLRHEAKELRAKAKVRRAELRRLRELPMSQRDPIAALRLSDRIGEYVLAAKDLDRGIVRLKAEIAQ